MHWRELRWGFTLVLANSGVWVDHLLLQTLSSQFTFNTIQQDIINCKTILNSNVGIACLPWEDIEGIIFYVHFWEHDLTDCRHSKALYGLNKPIDPT